MFFETALTTRRIQSARAAGLWDDHLLNDSLAAAVRRDPAKLAVDDTRQRLSYGELHERVLNAAWGFLALGIRRGDVVTVQLPNGVEFVVCVLALERIGAVVNPVAPIFRAHELRALLRLARPVAVVVAREFRGWSYPDMYEDLVAELPSVRACIAVGGSKGRFAAWDALLEAGRRDRHGVATTVPGLGWLRPDANDVAQLIFTSGTTGEPKGVMHTPNTLSAGVRPVAPFLRLGSDDVFHMASTLGHQTGFLYGVHLGIRLGASVVLQQVWNPEEFLELVARERISFTMGATPFLADVLRSAGSAHHDLSSLRTFICAGAPIPRPLAEEAAKRLPCRLVPGWGMTEVGLVTTVPCDDPVDRAVTSDGRPYPGMEVAVRREDGSAADAEEPGELMVRGAATFVGYVQGRSFTEAFFDSDGWFATGDVAALDRDGYLRIVGRSKDVIVRGGENVPVKEIEDVLLRHPKVACVALIGVPHPRLGEVGCACVVPSGPSEPTLDDLRGFLEANQVTRQFWPERVELLSELPMTPSGKIQKFRLRQRLSEASS